MLFLLALALVILTFILSMHYVQHFHVRWQKSAETPSTGIRTSDTLQTQTTLLRTTHYKPRCCFALKPIDEEFDFFPLSFLSYLAFMISLCLLMITTDIIQYLNTTNNESIIDLLYGYSIESYHNNSLFKLHSMNTANITDYILIYGIMVLSLWISLFSFYRYYTTLISTKTLSIVSTKTLLKKFTVYALIFCILFLLQIHVYYYLFPLVIFLFCAFNFFCCYKFASMLVKHYHTFLNITINNEIRIENQDILKSVLFTKNTSLICCCIQSLSLSIFVITYNANILYYLPILWSISSFILSLNFVRNYTFLQKRLFVFKQCCMCIWYKKVKTNANTNKPISEKRYETQKRFQLEHIDITMDTYHNFDAIMPKTVPNMQLPIGNSKSLELYDDIELKPPGMQRAQSDPLAAYPTISEKGSALLPLDGMDGKTEEEGVSVSGFSIVRKQKALELLGISPVSPSQTITQSMKVRNDIMKPPPLARFREMSGLSRLSRLSIYRDPDVADPNTPGPEPTSPLALHLNVTPLVDELGLDGAKEINFDVPSDIIEEQRRNSDIVSMAGSDHTRTVGNDIHASFGIMWEADTPQTENVLPIGKIPQPLRIKGHKKSHSEPQKLEEMFLSLDILAKYGFCSRQSITSVKQLTAYSTAFNENKELFDRRDTEIADQLQSNDY